MDEMTYEELMTIVRECAGADESVATTEGDIDTSFEDLGYDSLAMLETASRVEQAIGITLPDELVTELTTPRLFLDAVNGHRSEAV
jgi:act minimal PKS acyl carrier protein